jgi:hypothetical protein
MLTLSVKYDWRIPEPGGSAGGSVHSTHLGKSSTSTPGTQKSLSQVYNPDTLPLVLRPVQGCSVHTGRTSHQSMSQDCKGIQKHTTKKTRRKNSHAYTHALALADFSACSYMRTFIILVWFGDCFGSTWVWTLGLVLRIFIIYLGKWAHAPMLFCNLLQSTV